MTDRDNITSTAATERCGGHLTSLDRMRTPGTKRKPCSLTDAERRLLLEEIAGLSAELGGLQVWTAEIARRVTSPRCTQTERSA